jgi:hypothetical protein
MKTETISIHNAPTYEPYVIGTLYEGKGTYLGKTKGGHKFERHSEPKYKGIHFGLGPKYFFEKA